MIEHCIRSASRDVPRSRMNMKRFHLKVTFAPHSLDDDDNERRVLIKMQNDRTSGWLGKQGWLLVNIQIENRLSYIKSAVESLVLPSSQFEFFPPLEERREKPR